MNVERRAFSCQDSGNPVLDSVVNIAFALGLKDISVLGSLHEEILKIAANEPGGLQRRSKEGQLVASPLNKIPAPHGRTAQTKAAVRATQDDGEAPRDPIDPPR